MDNCYLKMHKNENALELGQVVLNFLDTLDLEKRARSPHHHDSVRLFYEMPNKGCIFYSQSKYGNINEVKVNDEVKHYAGMLKLLGFNEDTKYFENLKNKINTVLEDYIVAWSK